MESLRSTFLTFLLRGVISTSLRSVKNFVDFIELLKPVSRKLLKISMLPSQSLKEYRSFEISHSHPDFKSHVQLTSFLPTSVELKLAPFLHT